MDIKILKLPVFLTVIISLFLLSCDDSNNPRRIDYSTVPDPFSIAGAEKVTTQSGLEYYIVEEGICPSGDEDICTVNPRDQIDIFFTKRVKDDPDRIISSSYVNGVQTPVPASVGGGRVITEAGFKEGVIGMKAGEKRVLILPPDLAYGNNPNNQYSDQTIWIDVELDEIIY
ncbi:MAG: hypothetical protein CL666_06315 [Balneola sp.]|nr:hypothetical protein [Balneola sp.]|tara:strand:+ start:37337 stop:37852 length:516 start_codon:yes stop_codon:yes gene_type:complete